MMMKILMEKILHELHQRVISHLKILIWFDQHVVLEMPCTSV
jgi:hypothetical protein